MDTRNYDLVVIGAGPGGYAAVLEACKLGKKVAIIERDFVGGTCLNKGCIPTKAFLHASKMYDDMHKCSCFGLSFNNPTYDLDKIFKYADDTKSMLRQGMEQQLKHSGVEIICGTAFINEDKSITISSENADDLIINATNIIIATGASPSIPKITGIELDNVLTSDDILQGKFSPFKSVVIIGGGVIGVEFATIFSELGYKVSILEALPNILPEMDIEISRNLKILLKKHGVEVFTGVNVTSIEKSDGFLNCVFSNGKSEQSIPSEAVLVTVGRTGNTTSLFNENLSVQTEKGRILVDDKFETSANNIYAIGDVIKGVQLAHFASAQGICCVRQMFGYEPNIDLSVVPSCIYTHPEIASVGISCDKAKEMNLPIKTAKAITSANGKSIIEKDERGFVKLVFNKETDVIIGAEMMCSHASDMIGEFSSAIVNKLTYAQLAKVIRPHPTVNEIVFDALRNSL